MMSLSYLVTLWHLGSSTNPKMTTKSEDRVKIIKPSLAGKLENDTEIKLDDCVINVEAKTLKGDL